MLIPSTTALKNRARLLLEAMSERGRWVYAIPQDATEVIHEIALAEGLTPAEDGKFRSNDGAELHLLHDPELEVLLLIAEAPGVVTVMSKILERVGFFAQSQLLAVAYDTDDEEAPTALRTLAHMLATWGEPWKDLFDLHLNATAPAVRSHAIQSLQVASSICPEVPVDLLLQYRLEQEISPEIQEVLQQAIKEVVS